MKRQFLVSLYILILFSLSSCKVVPIEQPSLTPPVTPLSTQTHTPFVTGTVTVQTTLTPMPSSIATQLPTCTPIPPDVIYIIDEAVYNNSHPGLECGTAMEAIDKLQQALEEHHPAWTAYTWEDFQSKDRNIAYYIWNVSTTQLVRVNPRVLLVTAGIALDWQVPAEEELTDAVSEVGAALTKHYREYQFDEDLRERYPQAVNASTYALYAFFGHDLEKLNRWANEYDRMFGALQPRILTENCQPNVP